MNEQGLAGKIWRWLPGDNYELDTMASKLRFIGLSLSSSENVDGMEAEDLYGPGQTILELVEELRRFDRDYTTFRMRLSELASGIKFPINNEEAPGPAMNTDSGA
ncbi:MAG: hypothetical protein JJE15_12200 [Desulfobacteraceae bacterium]|nr:hypothetical protein [Desulfobacteraceae bacterium]